VRDIRTFLWGKEPEKHEMIEGIRTLLDEPSRLQKFVP